MTEKELINVGESILQSVRIEDIFNIESPQECVSDGDVTLVTEWVLNVYDYALNNLESQKLSQELINLCQYVQNGRRVATSIIQRILEVLNNIDNKRQSM